MVNNKEFKVMKVRGRLVLDILVIVALLIVAIAGCANSKEPNMETVPMASSESAVSETEATTTTEETTATETTQEQFAPDPTYEEAATYVRELLADGNSAEQVIAILMDEGRTEFDATALVNSVLMEDEGTVSNSSSVSTSSSSNIGSSSSVVTTSASGSGTSTNSGTSAVSSGTSSVQETTPTTTKSSDTPSTTATTETLAPATTSSPTPTQVPTKVIQTVYMRIVWDDDSIETMAAQGIDLNAERPEAVGIDIYACDENGNFNAGSIIDSSGGDAAETQIFAEADAILAKYGLTEGDYSYTAYKIENEYVYD